MKTETYTVIESTELDNLVRENLGVTNFSVVMDLESSNDVFHQYDPRIYYFGEGHRFEAGWKNDLREAEEQDYWHTQSYIAKLISLGYISDERVILVSVSW